MNESKIISEGTLRPQDLISAFLDELERRDFSKHNDILTTTTMPIGIWEDDSAEWWDSEDANELLHELFDVLEESAPPGYYFGAHEGDGALFGYWLINDDEQE